MVTEAGQPAVSPDASASLILAPAVPYARSWVNVLLDIVDRLPGPSWAAYLLALPPALLLTALPYWLSGVPVSDVRGDQAVWAFALVGSAWLVSHLDRVAREALLDFAPMLHADADALATLELELTVIPAAPAWLLLGASAARTTVAYVFQPESEALVGVVPIGVAIRWPFETVMLGLVLVLLYHTVRQLTLVARIHTMAPRINLFRPAPLYAFSRLTSRTAIGLVALVIPFGFNLSLAATAFDYFMLLSMLSAILVVAVLAFVWPLVGMHRRMEAEKHRLQGEAGVRLETLIAEIHGALDGGDLARADLQNRALANLVAERDLLVRFSTWPWQAGTAGAVASAVVLPLVIWLVTRLAERVL